MTLEQLYAQREEICLSMIEAEAEELIRLEQELQELEELIIVSEKQNAKEN